MKNYQPKITKEQFIRDYCENSEVSWSELSRFLVVVPCDINCDYDDCQGWRMDSRVRIEHLQRRTTPQQTIEETPYEPPKTH